MKLRVALTGASGTGKSALATFLSEKFNLPMNPVGSRSVAKSMGFASPYDVDKAGKRAEFQHRLAKEKIAWEAEHEEFVTDRTTLDNLVYSTMHDSACVDADFVAKIVQGMQRYTHVLYCPFDVFCNPGGDPARIQDRTYHQIYDLILGSFLDKWMPSRCAYHPVLSQGLEARKFRIEQYFRLVQSAG